MKNEICTSENYKIFVEIQLYYQIQEYFFCFSFNKCYNISISIPHIQYIFYEAVPRKMVHITNCLPSLYAMTIIKLNFRVPLYFQTSVPLCPNSITQLFFSDICFTLVTSSHMALKGLFY